MLRVSDMRKVVLILIVGILGAGVYWFLFVRHTGVEVLSDAATSTSRAILNLDFTEYRDVNYHFSIGYPKDLEVHIYDEGDGSRTITFEGELDDAQKARLIEIANKCPVHRTLENTSTITTTLAA